MGTREKQVVQDWLAATRGDSDEVGDAFAGYFHPDATWTLIGSTPISGTYHGLESIQDDFLGANFRGEERDGPSVQGLSQEYGIKPLAVEDVLSLEDGRVVVFCRSDGMGRNGISYGNQYCWIVTVRDDKIASMVEFCDTALIEQVQFDKKIVPRGTTRAVYER
jgi:uncharacterized protein